LLTVALPKQTGSAVGAFNRDVAAAEGLRKLDMEKFLQFRHAHFRIRHAALPSLETVCYIKMMVPSNWTIR
jgi:hypothetical protein